MEEKAPPNATFARTVSDDDTLYMPPGLPPPPKLLNLLDSPPPPKLKLGRSVSSGVQGQAENVRVVVRFRPLNSRETGMRANAESGVFDFKGKTIEVKDPEEEAKARAGGRRKKNPNKTFTYHILLPGPDAYP